MPTMYPLALLALFQAAVSPPPPAQSSPSAAAPPKVVKICREGGRALGTHMRSGRICKTAEQWEAEKTEGQYIPSMTIKRRQDIPFEGTAPQNRPPCC